MRFARSATRRSPSSTKASTSGAIAPIRFAVVRSHDQTDEDEAGHRLDRAGPIEQASEDVEAPAADHRSVTAEEDAERARPARQRAEAHAECAHAQGQEDRAERRIPPLSYRRTAQ